MFNLGLLEIFMIMVFMFTLSFVFSRKHLLATLLSLEGVVLSLFGLLCVYGVSFHLFYFYILAFLTFSACEGALGLSLLVMAVRWWGEDRMMSLSLLQD